MAATLDAARIRAILLDIEGTTTPVDFVFKILFPFASARVESFLHTHRADPEVAAAIEALRDAREREAQRDATVPEWNDASAEARVKSAAAFCRWLIECDRKLTPLKTLQGRIWQEGYRSGALRGEVYPDIAPALARWREQGRDIAIFSSGSVLAQKLLFAHSTAGDLTPHLRAYFDTSTGAKQEEASYRRIAESLGRAAQEILFISDVVAEVAAAQRAGYQVLLCVRPGAQEPRGHGFAVIHSFDEVLPVR